MERNKRYVYKGINAHPYSALGTIFGTVGIAMAKMGGSKDEKSSTPLPIEKESIPATSKDEEDL